MKISKIAQDFQKMLNANSPVVLTSIAVTGTLLTGYLAAKAGYQAREKVTAREVEFGVADTTNLDRARETWMLYVPAVAAAVGTSTCMVLATRVGLKRTAAAATAFAIADRNLTDYKDKASEIFGKGKAQKVEDSVAQDRVTASPEPSEEMIHYTGMGDVLCYEDYTDRYFYSNMETLRRAENAVNHRILHGGEDYATLSYFYDQINLGHTGPSDDIGWNTGKLCNLRITATVSDKGRPALLIGYNFHPFGI